MDANGSWLCPTERDRERLLDMSARVRRARTVSSVAAGSALLICVPWFGPWPLVLLLLVGANLATIEGRLERARKPEYIAATSMLFIQIVIGVGVVLTGGPESSTIAWVVIPTAIAAARFGRHVVIALSATAVAIMVGTTVAVDPSGFADNPAPLITALALLVSIVVIVSTLMNAELQHREEAVIDPLTGLLNRKALASRFQELELQACQSEASVCVIASDLDSFKQVNDQHGHARGDEVLREVTRAMRDCQRTFELMYRVGGEEFLTVLPGIDLPEGVAVAERLRRAVAACRPAGLKVTISAGVAAASGAEVSYESLVGAADRALYEAKNSGRDTVRADGHEDIAPMLEAVGVVVA
jgi:diguanylate cyclase (GGDEF)-like protein